MAVTQFYKGASPRTTGMLSFRGLDASRLRCDANLSGTYDHKDRIHSYYLEDEMKRQLDHVFNAFSIHVRLINRVYLERALRVGVC